MKKIWLSFFLFNFLTFPLDAFSKDKNDKTKIAKKSVKRAGGKNPIKKKKPLLKTPSKIEETPKKDIADQKIVEKDEIAQKKAAGAISIAKKQASADLSFLGGDLKDVQRTYVIWDSLIKDPLPDFNVLKLFIQEHPNWPSMPLLLEKYEKQLSLQVKDEDILKGFEDNPPVSIAGVRIYAKTLMQSGQSERAGYFVKKLWRESDASEEELDAFQKEFYEILQPEDHQARVDRLLSGGKIEAAKKVLGWLNKRLEWYPKPQRDLALMRIDLLDNKIDRCVLEEKLKETKRIFKNDPGLLYEEIKWRRVSKENDAVIALFNSDVIKGIEKSNAVLFWGERNIMARRMIEEGSFQKALDILKDHQLTKGEQFAIAEWLAAFLEIIYLKQPDAGFDRLKKLYDKVRMPISLSRVAYWLGVASEKMKADDEAVRWYQKAAQHVGTYYGQLAICWLQDHKHNVPKAPIFVDESFSLSAKERFNKRELVQAVRAIAAMGEPIETVELFFKQLGKEIPDGEEYRMLTQLAVEIGPARMAVAFSRSALDKMIITKGTYPVLDEAFLGQTVYKFSNNNPIYPHIIHALIRRESAFDPQALSSAGAKGLMQVIDKTAAVTIQKLSFLCEPTCKDPRKYTEPLYNVAIGTSYFKEQLDKYNGSIVLALCAYNAGPEAVDNLFRTCIGDPLTQKTNMVQWIELIPYGETRNYVMRVLESFVMYVELARLKNPGIQTYRMTDLINLGTAQL
jgi:soluble lytic murein transglycosylase